MRLTTLATLVAFAVPLPLAAQDNSQTLADIRQELSVLHVELQQLTRELSTTGGAQTLQPSASILDRVNVIESELQRLTAKSEELEFRINSIVKDGTNRIGDIEFRLCEITPSCDLSKLGETSVLGGGALPQAPRLPPVESTNNTSAPQLAVGERADFDRAKGELDNGSFRSAADLFAAFTEAYPAGPLTGPAHFHQGDALSQLGETAPAARAYLNAFSADPDGEQAPMALLRLGQSLGDLGQTNEACITLGEVSTRFPGGEAASEAETSRVNLGCL
ncbi:tol-pal system protein YbgF [Aliiruegeria sabulilitoris]|uniref:tol-pal system protein YbgF n=1 Tax=Aliiruegeria sabulilitoris TaxID=1510458 RepID=UPI000829C669|nr:tol-pal system protein YbgF [Aliiruegeria sabulilitoris]NDR55968.1 tol-pal system protein YbgF [Pseudoruegeria sp. M32A2M]